MSHYRPKIAEGGRYFFTVVTYKRHAFLTDETARLLPDHLHCLWRLPENDSDYSRRWSLIKRLFSKRYLAAGGTGLPQTASRIKKREAGIWQRRFWEHRIRDQQDYWRHVHYIHYNPVKHGWAERPEQWPYSTYHQFHKVGLYDHIDWNCLTDEGISDRIEYNE